MRGSLRKEKGPDQMIIEEWEVSLESEPSRVLSLYQSFLGTSYLN